jgi:hypothetical protein
MECGDFSYSMVTWNPKYVKNDTILSILKIVQNINIIKKEPEINEFSICKALFL